MPNNMKNTTRKTMRAKRKMHTRESVSGSHERPRLSVYRSNTAMSVQFIDDQKHETLVSGRVKGKNTSKALELAQMVLDLAKKKKITTVIFDRSGFRYHGVIKKLAEALREGGLTF